MITVNSSAKIQPVYSFTDNYAAYANWGKTFQGVSGTGTIRW